MKKEKPKYNMWQNTGFMVKMAWQRRKSVVLIVVALIFLSVGINIANLFIAPTILGLIENQAEIIKLITTIIFFTVALILLNGVYSYFDSTSLLARVDVRTVIIQSFNRKFDITSYPNIQNKKFIKLHSKCQESTCSNNSAAEYIWTVLTDLFVAILTFALYLTLLTNVNIFMVVLILVISISGYFVNKKINEWGYRHKDESEKLVNEIYYAKNKSQDVAFLKDIRIFGMKDWINEVHSKTMSLYHSFNKKREKIYFGADLIDVVLSLAKNLLAYFYLINLTLENNLSSAEFLLYFTAITGFNQMLTKLLDSFSLLHKQSLDISVVREFLEFDEVFKFKDGKKIEPNKNIAYEIILKNVSFKYENQENFTLKNINLTIKQGEKLAVVGLNGAGKTTLVKLICGFYDPTEGEVLLNGVNIKEYNRKDYYKHFTAVFQDFSVLDITLAENVAQDNLNIDMEKVYTCIEKAGLTEKVNTLPNKYDTHIGRNVYEDGVELSGGETQRLMLARALYKDAPIILLDEPTAALDPLAESDMYQKYDQMTLGRTSVYISHRLASTRFCDRIILIDGAVIKEEGTHESLLNLNGIYANLFEVQKKYYEKEGASNE